MKRFPVVIIVVLIIMIIANNIGWSVAWRKIRNSNDKIQLQRDSLKLISDRLLNERDSLLKIDSITQVQNIQLDDSIKTIINEITTLQNRHYINRDYIRNSNDQQYQEYITNNKLPDFNERYPGQQHRDTVHGR